MEDIRKIYSEIYDNHVEPIYRFIFLRVNSEEVAKDITSETFVRGWESFQKSFALNPITKPIDNPRAFLYKIARNLIVDHYREKGKNPVISVELDPVADPRPNLQENVLSQSDMDSIRFALAKINEDYQEVIIWHYLDDLSVPEIAKLLDKSEGAVRVMLHRAMDALREKIQEV